MPPNPEMMKNMMREMPQQLYEEIFSLPKEGLENNPGAVLQAIFNSKNRMMIFQEEKIDVARKALEKMDPKPKILIECGTYVGCSSVAWGQMLKEMNGNRTEGVKVYCCEVDPQLVKISSDIIALAGLSDVVQVIEGMSGDTIRKLKDDGTIDKIDVLFLDHWEDSYLPDLQLCEELSLFHKGSVVIADNVDFPGAPAYAAYVKAGGQEGAKVKYTTESLASRPISDVPQRRPNIVEVTTVVQV